ncbi:MAG: hypothetical protein ACYCYI_14775, partial [Saccharofermentanales bacterium]
MKKLLVSIISLILTLTFMMSFSVVFADSPEILLNPGFEDDINGWGSAVNCTNVSMKSYAGVTPRSGEYFVYSDNRYGVADSPMQLITGQMNFYKSGTYRMSGSFRLPSSASMSTTTAKVVIRLVSSDKSYGSTQYPGINWYTSAEVNVSKTSWAHVSTDIPMEWPENTLVSAEFYYLTDISGTAMDMCFDDAGMIKVGYSGNPYVFPTISVTPRPTRVPTITPTTAISSSISQNVTSTPAPTIPAQSSSISQPGSSSLSGGNSSVSSVSTSSEQTGSDISNAGSESAASNAESTATSNSGSVSSDDSGNSSSSISGIIPGGKDKSGPISPAGYAIIALVSLLVLAAGAMLFYNLKVRNSPDTKLPAGNSGFGIFLRRILSGENPAIYSSIAIMAAGVVFISLFVLIPALAGNKPDSSSITSSDSAISGSDSQNTGSSEDSQNQSILSGSGSFASSVQSAISSIMSGISTNSSKAASSQAPTNIVYPPVPTTAPAMLQK